MDALSRATSIMERLHADDDPNGVLREAVTWAAIAQAEQLRRIADALYVEIRGEQIQITDVLHAVYEALEDRNSKGIGE